MLESEQTVWPAGGKRYGKNARKVEKLNISHAKALRTTLPMVQAGVNEKCADGCILCLSSILSRFSGTACHSHKQIRVCWGLLSVMKCIPVAPGVLSHLAKKAFPAQRYGEHRKGSSLMIF